nr:hypothetical protein [uncultured Anaerobutyricum sp.]
MINTSAEYKEAILKNRVLHHETKIEFTDGTVITAQDAELHTFKISDNTSNTNSFDIGAAIAKQLEIKIDNIEGAYSERNFSGAKITARAGLELSETTEWLKKGIFYAEPGTLSGDTVSVTALDSMTKFDKSYTESKLQYPATLGQIVRDACSVCNVSMSADIASFPQSNFVVTTRPSDTSLTFRQVLQCVGEIACLFFKINEDDKLTANWYNTSLLESKNIKENTETVKIEDYTGTIGTDDVVVTGIKVVEESTTDSDTEKNETEYLYGTKGYVLEIKENKLIQDGKGASVAEFVGKKVNGLTFRPLTIKCQGDPAVETGDIAIVTDRKGKEYKTILTGVTYTAKALQELLCGAVSPERLSSTRYSKATQIYRELRKTLTQQRSGFSKALKDLQNAMDEKQGLYPITEKQEDGGNILYFCDKPIRKESKVVIELNAKGWGMSTDGGKTWNAGVLVDGTTITKILNAVGINADWINTGALTVKGNGEDTILSIDVKTGKLITKAAQIGGWNVDEKAIYKDVTINENDYRVYLQPPNAVSGEETWVFSVQKKINGSYNGVFVIRASGSVASYSAEPNTKVEIKNGLLEFCKKDATYNDSYLVYGNIRAGDNGLEIQFSDSGDYTDTQILNAKSLRKCYTGLIFKSYGNQEVSTNGVTREWKELRLATNVSKQDTNICRYTSYSAGYHRIIVNKKGTYHFAIRIITRSPSAYKRVYVTPTVNGERYESYTDTECSIAANLECQTLKNYVLDLEKNDAVGFAVASVDGVAFYVKIQDMNVFVLDYESKYS